MGRRVVRFLLVVGLVVLFRLLERRGVRPYGTLLGIPYEFRVPTPGRVRERLWNRRDRRMLTAPVLGWGYAVNLAELARRLGLFR